LKTRDSKTRLILHIICHLNITKRNSKNTTKMRHETGDMVVILDMRDMVAMADTDMEADMEADMVVDTVDMVVATAAAIGEVHIDNLVDLQKEQDIQELTMILTKHHNQLIREDDVLHHHLPGGKDLQEDSK